jgi:hypothetical protein
VLPVSAPSSLAFSSFQALPAVVMTRAPIIFGVAPLWWTRGH